MKKLTKEEMERKAEAVKELKEHFDNHGRTVYCILRHCSQSGMLREISLLVPCINEKGQPYLWDITHYASLVLEMCMGKNYGIRIGGCGMDMGFALVYNLGRCLYPNGDGKTVTGRNGDKDIERDGGYLLKHSWI